MAKRRVSKNLQQGRSGGEGTGYRGDNICQKKSRGTDVLNPESFFVNRFWGRRPDSFAINEALQDGKLGITIQDPLPESGRWTCLLYFTCSYCILSRVWKLATSLLILRHYEHLFLFSMLILHVICLYLLNIYHFTYTSSHTHTEAHTHKHTFTISTQEEWRQPGTGAWLRRVEERLCLRPCTPKKNVKKNR